jgi:hypothetical protein
MVVLWNLAKGTYLLWNRITPRMDMMRENLEDITWISIADPGRIVKNSCPAAQGEWLVIRIQIIHSYTSPDPSRHSNDIASQYTVETSRQDSLVRLFCRSDHLYHSCQLVVQGVGFTCAGMALPHQLSGRVFLCLESVETRSTQIETMPHPALHRTRPSHHGSDLRSSRVGQLNLGL